MNITITHKVEDLDGIIPRYHVLDRAGRNLGEKVPGYGWVKPTFGKNGGYGGDNWGALSQRIYKLDPPWLKYPVVEIRIDGYCVGLVVHKPE